MAAETPALYLWELYEKYKIPYEPKNFITTCGWCGNRNLFMPMPIVPAGLMEPKKAQKAQDLLDKCTQIAGLWGERQSKFEDPDFILASTAFKEITGVEVEDILQEAFTQMEEELSFDPPF